MGKYTKNFYYMWMYGALLAVATTMSSVMTAYYLHCGLTESQISFSISAMQIINLVVSLCCSGMASKYRDSRKITALMFMISGLFPVMYLLMGYGWLMTEMPFLVMLAINTATTIAIALRVIFEYKLPCEVLDMKYYSEFSAYQGIFSGVAGMLTGMILPLFYQYISQLCVIAGSMLFSAVVMILAAICILRTAPQKETAPIDTNNTPKYITPNPVKEMMTLWQNREFRMMIIPNLLRGTGAGMISILTVLALMDGVISENSITMISSVTYAGTFISSFLYIQLVRHLGIPMTGLVGAVCFSVICFSMVGNATIFLLIYGISSIGNNLVANAIPDMIYHSVTGEIISSFQVWRLALTTLGSAISTAIFGAMMYTVPAEIILIVGSSGLILCAFFYYLYYKNRLLPMGKV